MASSAVLKSLMKQCLASAIAFERAASVERVIEDVLAANYWTIGIGETMRRPTGWMDPINSQNKGHMDEIIGVAQRDEGVGRGRHQ